MIVVLLIFVGLSLGSFINALVWRLHLKEDIEHRKSKTAKKSKHQSINDRKYSILYGHSMCPKCQHQLAAIDLIPVFSWLLLHGKCRYCKKSISRQYPFIELLTAALFVSSYIYWPISLLTTHYSLLVFIVWLVTLVGLIALAVYDLRWMILPDKIVYPLIGITIASLLAQLALGRHVGDYYGIIWAALIGGGVFGLIFYVSKGKWIGGGDVKLGFLLGLVVARPEYSFMFLFLASLMATFFSLPLLITKKVKTSSKIPFGPFLIIAAIVVVLFGSQILNAYKSIFGL